jgi:hypothetical protein
MTTRHLRARCLGIVAALVLAGPATAQEIMRSDGTPDLSNVPLLLERYAQEVTRNSPSLEASSAMNWLRRNHPAVPPVIVSEVLAGLEHLALHSDNMIVRHRALTALAGFGSAEFGGVPRRGILSRVLRIYQDTDDRVVRGLVVDGLIEPRSCTRVQPSVL